MEKSARQATKEPKSSDKRPSGGNHSDGSALGGIFLERFLATAPFRRRVHFSRDSTQIVL